MTSTFPNMRDGFPPEIQALTGRCRFDVVLLRVDDSVDAVAEPVMPTELGERVWFIRAPNPWAHAVFAALKPPGYNPFTDISGTPTRTIVRLIGDHDADWDAEEAIRRILALPRLVRANP